MITGHGIHFEVIFEAQLYRKDLSFSPEWPSLLMFYRNWYQFYASVYSRVFKVSELIELVFKMIVREGHSQRVILKVQFEENVS